MSVFSLGSFQEANCACTFVSAYFVNMSVHVHVCMCAPVGMYTVSKLLLLLLLSACVHLWACQQIVVVVVVCVCTRACQCFLYPLSREQDACFYEHEYSFTCVYLWACTYVYMYVCAYVHECTAPVVCYSPTLMFPAFVHSVVLFLALFCHLENDSLCPTLLSTLTTVTALTGYSYKFFRRTCGCLSAVKSGACTSSVYCAVINV